MKVAIVLLCSVISQVMAFTVVPHQRAMKTALMAEYVPLEGEGKINLKVCHAPLFIRPIACDCH